VEQKSIGLIAGNGRFPVLAALEASRQGYRVAVCALRGEADSQLESMADAWTSVKLGEMGKLVRFFKEQQVTQLLMAGKVQKVRLFQENVQPDFDMLKILMKTRDFKDDSLLLGIASYLEQQGLPLIDSTHFLRDCLPGEGGLGKKKPSKEVLEDISFGFEMAKAIAGLDIGQTVIVKKKAVLAVEAIEGTDLAIMRGFELGREGVVAVKVAKPNQDMRFDVPTIGMQTLNTLIEAKAAALAFEAGKTLLLDREEFISKADQHGIVIYGIKGQE